jgi:predicted nucleic acid-binding protein
MVKALFDTNVLIDYLNTVGAARAEIDRYSDKSISVMSWIEVMVGAAPNHEAGTRTFLARFEIVQLDESIAEDAVALRRKYRMKLPDAVIWATARTRNLMLITRNTKDFPANEPGIRMPYKI